MVNVHIAFQTWTVCILMCNTCEQVSMSQNRRHSDYNYINDETVVVLLIHSTPV